MDYEAELNELAAENLALQALLVGLCVGLCKTGKRQIVQAAFECADMFAEAAAVQFAGKAPPKRLAGVARVLEQLREYSIP